MKGSSFGHILFVLFYWVLDESLQQHIEHNLDLSLGFGFRLDVSMGVSSFLGLALYSV